MSFEAEQSEDHDAVETDDEVGEPCPTSPCLGMPPVFIELNECLRLAELRQPEAMFQAGMRYRFGRQVEQSTERANAWLTRAAQAGHADAQNHLARMIQQGPAPSQRDFERAAVLLQRAVDQNHVEAIFNLAECYEIGQGVRHDPIWADHLNTLAARIMRNVVAAKEKADAAAAAIAAQKKMIEDMEARARRK